MIDFLLSLDRDSLLVFAIPLLVGITLFALSRLSAFFVRRSGGRPTKLLHYNFLQQWRDRKYTEAATTFFVGELPKLDNIIGRILALLVIGLVVVVLAWVFLHELAGR
jgi:hypothetical protein